MNQLKRLKAINIGILIWTALACWGLTIDTTRPGVGRPYLLGIAIISFCVHAYVLYATENEGREQAKKDNYVVCLIVAGMLALFITYNVFDSVLL